MAPSQDNTRICIITGGSRGLGKSMALHLAEHGRDVIITYLSNPAAAAEVVAQVQAMDRKAVALRLDVADSTQFDGFVEVLRAKLASIWNRERFDFLVNNAGVALHASFAETSEAQFDNLVNVHFKSTFFLTQKLLPLMQDGGRILNVTTGLTRFSFPGYAAYASMKGAVDVLTHYMALELGARGIAVNSVAPGAIATDFGGGRVRDNPALNKMIAEHTALGRAGLPDDIGGAVAMLLAQESNWITGQRVEFSGGMNL